MKKIRFTPHARMRAEERGLVAELNEDAVINAMPYASPKYVLKGGHLRKLRDVVYGVRKNRGNVLTVMTLWRESNEPI